MLAYPAKYGTEEKVFGKCYRDPYITHTTRENCSEKEGETDSAIPNGSMYEKILVYACCCYGSRAPKKSYKFCARFAVAKFAERRSVMAGVTGTLRLLTRFVIQLVILLLRDEPWAVLLRDEPWAVLLHEARKMYRELFLAATIYVQLWCSFIRIE